MTRRSPKIPSRDTALRRTVRERLEKRPDLRDDQYVDMLMLKVRLRRHAAKIATQLQGGVLEKGSGQPKKALDAQLQIARAMMQIDDMLPKPPSPDDAAERVVRIVTGGRCSKCPCEDCKATRGVEPPPEEPGEAATDAEVIEGVKALAEQQGRPLEDSEEVADLIIDAAQRSARGDSDVAELSEEQAREAARELAEAGAKIVPFRRRDVNPETGEFYR